MSGKWFAFVSAVVVGAVLAPSPSPAGAVPLAQPRFVVPDRSPTTGVLPEDLATGDFTSDGRIDVAVANLGPDAFVGGVDVLPGDGAGGLGDPIRTSVGVQNGVEDLGVGDFNEDGRLDLAAVTGTTSGTGSTRVLTGNGAGGFALGQTLLPGTGLIEAAELTGDGHVDLIFVSTVTSVVKLYPGLGTGRFGAAVTFNRTWDAYDFELADVNGDGRLDIVGASGGPIWTMLNQGGGSFGEQLFSFQDELSGFQLTVADFDGDGNPDVAVVDGSGAHVFIGRGAGDGTFQASASYSNVSFALGEIVAGDWTGDGRPDLIVDHAYFSESNIVVLLRNAGDGTFGDFTYWTTGNDDPTPVDLNADGALDLVALGAEAGGVVYSTLNPGNGRFRAPQDTLTSALGTPATADVDHDGRLDVVMLGPRVPVLLGRGGGRFTSVVSNNGVSEGVGEIELADVNEDGNLDIVAALTHIGSLPNNLAILLGDGAGHFGGPTRLGTGDSFASNQSVGVGDVNADGHVDIVAKAGQQLAVRLGNGNGTFQNPILSGSAGLTQPGTHLADITGDGVLDVVAVVKTGGEDFGIGEIRVERGNGDGTFTLVQTLNYDGNPAAGLVADLNGDGRPDVAVPAVRGSNGGRSGLRVTLNTGSALGPIVFYPATPWPMGDIDASDVDLDGDLDIVGSGPGTVSIGVNDGTGTLTGPVELIGTASTARLVADYTGDGRPDILSLNPTDRPLYSLYVNTRR